MLPLLHIFRLSKGRCDMRRLILVAMLLLVFCVRWVLADELTIELDVGEMIGPSTSEVVPFSFNIPIEQIQDITLQLQGTYVDQVILCGSTPGMIVFYTGGRIKVHLGDDVLAQPERTLIVEFPSNAGDPIPFDRSFFLLEGDLTSFEFLADGATELGLFDYPSTHGYGYSDCYGATAWATISSATLIVRFDTEVPTTSRSWGSIKSIYR